MCLVARKSRRVWGLGSFDKSYMYPTNPATTYGIVDHKEQTENEGYIHIKLENQHLLVKKKRFQDYDDNFY